jgi:hypothetical protein
MRYRTIPLLIILRPDRESENIDLPKIYADINSLTPHYGVMQQIRVGNKGAVRTHGKRGQTVADRYRILARIFTHGWQDRRLHTYWVSSSIRMF